VIPALEYRISDSDYARIVDFIANNPA
jgi:hypothetical protein